MAGAADYLLSDLIGSYSPSVAIVISGWLTDQLWVSVPTRVLVGRWIFAPTTENRSTSTHQGWFSMSGDSRVGCRETAEDQPDPRPSYPSAHLMGWGWFPASGLIEKRGGEKGRRRYIKKEMKVSSEGKEENCTVGVKMIELWPWLQGGGGGRDLVLIWEVMSVCKSAFVCVHECVSLLLGWNTGVLQYHLWPLDGGRKIAPNQNFLDTTVPVTKQKLLIKNFLSRSTFWCQLRWRISAGSFPTKVLCAGQLGREAELEMSW